MARLCCASKIHVIYASMYSNIVQKNFLCPHFERETIKSQSLYLSLSLFKISHLNTSCRSFSLFLSSCYQLHRPLVSITKPRTKKDLKRQNKELIDDPSCFERGHVYVEIKPFTPSNHFYCITKQKVLSVSLSLSIPPSNSPCHD